MKTVTVGQIQRLDKIAIERVGIPSLVLMENAGRASADEIKKYLRRTGGSSVCVVCGMGNNAGDGFVIARHLWEAAIKTRVVMVGTPGKLKDDARVNYRILKKLRCPVTPFNRAKKYFRRWLKSSDIVVDAVFGVGLNRDVKEPFFSVIENINQLASKVVSVDIPSGLDGTTGKIYGTCVSAKKTITFSFAKKGFFKNEGPRRTGKIHVVDIGIPKRCQSQIKI